MAMDSATLTTAIKNAIDTKAEALNPDYGDIKADISDFIQAIAEAVAEEVVSHISTNAQISGVNVTVASVSGVTPGGGVSGPGSGTGTAGPGSIS